MKEVYSNILSFAGYTFNTYSDIHPPPLDIEIGRNSTYVAKSRKSKKKKYGTNIISMCYSILIACLICWSVPYNAYIAFNSANLADFGRSWFQILYVVLYYYGIKYFKQNHFYENIMTNSNLMKFLKSYIPMAFILSLSLAIINLVILILTNMPIYNYRVLYDNANENHKFFIGLLLILESLYSYQTFTINACIFVVNMKYHSDTVSNYKNELTEYIRNSMSTIRKLNIVAIEYSQMKDNFDQTVTLLTPFFSFLNFMGFITVYFYLRSLDTLSITEITNMVLFFLVDCIYIDAIQKVYSNVSAISDIIGSTSVIATFFGNKKYSLPDFNKINKMHYDNNILQDPDVTRIHNYSSNEPVDICSLSEHSEHALTEHELNELSAKQKPIEPVINKPTLTETKLTEPIQHEQAKTSVTREIVNTNQVALRQVLQSSVSTDQMMDWLILQGIVGGRWKTFRIYGVEFTNTALLSKIFGIFVSVILSAEIGSHLNWW